MPHTTHHLARRVRPTLAAGGSLALLVCLAGTPAGAQEDPYADIELQARTNLLVNDDGYNLPPGSSFNSITPDLNDAGDVAFRVQVATFPDNPYDSTAAVWLGGGGEGDLVYRAPADLPVGEVTLNEEADLAFTVSGAGVDNKLWHYDSDTGEAQQVGTNPFLPTSYSYPSIDEEGDIGFQGNFSGDRAFGAVIDGTGVFYVEDAGLDPDSPYSYLYTPRYNDAKQIAGKVSLLESFNHQEVRIWEADGSSTRVLATQNVDPDSPYRAFDNSVGFSDNGIVAAIATRADTNAKVLVRVDSSGVQEVAGLGEDSPLASFEFFSPDVNDAGEVVFRAREKDGTQGVWVADGTALTRVAAQGDTVETDQGTGQFGQHDTSPVFGGAPRINNHGDVSFTAGLHPEGDNQVEWGSGVFVAYAGADEEPPPPPAGPETVERLAGENRYATAAEVATATFEPGVPTAFIASGDNYPDALAGAALAGSEGSPVLLTQDSHLPSATRAALEGLEPQRIVILGDERSVDADVAAVLADYTDGDVSRIGGAQRYATAAMVAAEFSAPDTVYVATGLDYPDALAAAARAGAGDDPVLLVKKDAIPSDTRAALEAAAPERIVVLGDENTIEDDIALQLSAYAETVERVAGADRYETAAMLSAELEAATHGFVATGQDWPDALAGAAAAAHLDAPVVLAKLDALPSATRTELERLEPPHLRVLGDELTINEDVFTALEDLDYTD